MLLFANASFSAKAKKDTLEAWAAKFYEYANLNVTDDGNWTVLRKRYSTNQDSVIVINNRNGKVVDNSIVLGGRIDLLKSEGFLVTGNNRAEFLNLNTKQKSVYTNVRVTYPIHDLKQFATLDDNKVLRLYNTQGKEQSQINDVLDFPVTHSKKLYYYKKINGISSIFALSTGTAAPLYSTANEIKKVEIDGSGKNLYVTEDSIGIKKMSFVNLEDRKVFEIPFFGKSASDYFSVTEIQEGKAFFITLNLVNKVENKLVDIWYGNDPNLEKKISGDIRKIYGVFYTDTQRFLQLPTDKFSTFESLNNTHVFLAYQERKNYNYIILDPQLEDTFLYDINRNTFLPLGSLKPLSPSRTSGETISSPNGNYILTSIHDKKWSILNMDDVSQQLIDKDNLRNPVFAENGRTAFFESDNDLWKYDISTHKLTQLNIAPHKSVEIMNTIRKNSSSGQHNSINFIAAKDPMILRIKDLQNNRTSYLTWKDSKQQTVFEPTENQIEEIAYSRNFADFYALEENFQFAPRLLAKKRGKPQKILLKSYGNKDLKLDIVNYALNDGTDLKAVLYYPKNYDPDKKYPMVVHVYQIQSVKANMFLKPGYNNPDGFDIRALIERGYFVFLPDTTIGKDGPGPSGLECVNNALDAIKNIRSVDFTKIGLIGHSFGGYLTDYIATHSDRFATYVSGSGDSDLIKSYFSYNYHFAGPHYWAFEDFGVYAMGSFKDFKDKYLKNNPIHFVDQVSRPMLLWTGKKDRHVPWERTMEFYVGLKRNKKFVIALFYPEAGHVLRNNSLEKKDLHTKVLQWWDYFLKDKKDINWIDKQLMKDAF